MFRNYIKNAWSFKGDQKNCFEKEVKVTVKLGTDSPYSAKVKGPLSHTAGLKHTAKWDYSFDA